MEPTGQDSTQRTAGIVRGGFLRSGRIGKGGQNVQWRSFRARQVCCNWLFRLRVSSSFGIVAFFTEEGTIDHEHIVKTKLNWDKIPVLLTPKPGLLALHHPGKAALGWSRLGPGWGSEVRDSFPVRDAKTERAALWLIWMSLVL